MFLMPASSFVFLFINSISQRPPCKVILCSSFVISQQMCQTFAIKSIIFSCHFHGMLLITLPFGDPSHNQSTFKTILPLSFALILTYHCLLFNREFLHKSESSEIFCILTFLLTDSSDTIV